MAAYFIKHRKTAAIKFVGHLDLQSALQRTMARAQLPVAYSKGFSPHMELSSAQPLAVGMTSQAEYLRLALKEELKGEEVLRRLCQAQPPGIEFLKVWLLPDKFPAPMALLDAVTTTLELPWSEQDVDRMVALLDSREPMVATSKNKKGKTVAKDLRALIIDYDKLKPTSLKITSRAGSRAHLNLDQLLIYFQDKLNLPSGFVAKERLEMYHLKEGSYVPLEELF